MIGQIVGQVDYMHEVERSEKFPTLINDAVRLQHKSSFNEVRQLHSEPVTVEFPVLRRTDLFERPE